MPDPDPKEVTLNTLHEDLKDGFTDLKTTLLTGFRSLPTRESSEEMIRLLREGNRLQEGRLTQLDLRLREQHLELQQALRTMADGVRALVNGQRVLDEGIRALVNGQRTLDEAIRALADGQRALHEDIRALIARLDALIKGRGDGASTP